MKLRWRHRRFTTWERVNLVLIVVGLLLAGLGWLIGAEVLLGVGIAITAVGVIISPFEGQLGDPGNPASLN